MLTKGLHQNLRNALFAAAFLVCLPLGSIRPVNPGGGSPLMSASFDKLAE
jgi:hypothetical protein